MKIIYLRKITVMLFVFALLSNVTFAQKADWRLLFNGKDLKNWDTYLKPSPAATDQTPM